MRFLAFDGLRGLFSIFVVLSHIPAATFLYQSGLESSGRSLVDLFFVFSGFVIVAGYEQRLLEGYSFRRFLIARLGRIYPIHVVMLLVFILTEIAFATILSPLAPEGRGYFEGPKSLFAIVTNLTLIQAWGIHDQLTWNFPSWSLSTEWAAYLLFAASLFCLRRRFLYVTVVVIPFSMAMLVLVAPDGMSSFQDFGVFRSFLGFSCGTLSYYLFGYLYQRDMFKTVPVAVFTALELAGFALMIGLQLAIGRTEYAVILPVVFILLMVLFAYGRGHISALMSTAPMMYLGAISLSIYVVHAWIVLRAGNVMMLVQKLTGITLFDYTADVGQQYFRLSLSPLAANLYALVIVVLTVIVSHFTYRWVELPGQTLFRNWGQKLWPSASPAPQGQPATLPGTR
ncbi:acyltransferase family protein [Agrobacterium sp. ES01]|uniref:acyltransferase family protein n=1 Tax=Agrobacterium sp. ES01 TaxID=3420714 RepID=UPI003D1426BE